MRFPFRAPTALLLLTCLCAWNSRESLHAQELTPAPQDFRQEVALHFGNDSGVPQGPLRLLFTGRGEQLFAYAASWWVCQNRQWKLLNFPSSRPDSFTVPSPEGLPVVLPLAADQVRQLFYAQGTNFVMTANRLLMVNAGSFQTLEGPPNASLRQAALGSASQLFIASDRGLWRWDGNAWVPLEVTDAVGRIWVQREVSAVTFDSHGQLWFACRAGVGCQTANGWKFYEGKDGLPWNDFTCAQAGPGDDVWFGTRLGAIRFSNGAWHYRQGKRWLANDVVRQIAVGPNGEAWFATDAGLTRIEFRPMSLAAKAELYETEIERFIKRTPFGFVAEAQLRTPGDKTSANPQDSDNDGLWTAMYGAGEAFAFAATRDPTAKQRAKKAFEALQFLQTVTQGAQPAPPNGFVARTIRPVDWPNPNIGRLAGDIEEQKHDRLWKAYEPRWPRSADGKWFWKSDTSSDELDGHYFFYPLYFDFCTQTEAERQPVREVVRNLTDHLVTHGFKLVDHDGKVTRWGVYDPTNLNTNPDWWEERGLKSLSMLSYLAVAAHVTGDAKYQAISRQLVEQHGYAQNAMHYKIQHGPGSGNQSDDEMAFMCFYNLLRYSTDEPLKTMIRYSFFRAWANEAAELNPFFNFAYAGANLGKRCEGTWGTVDVSPWSGWHQDAMATLYGFPLDRLNWGHQNSHRLDITRLSRIQASDLAASTEQSSRGYRVNGKVLPVENRHFNHWNTDPWQLDYGGSGEELAAGTVFLLPYYMGLYHGFIAKPKTTAN